MCMASRVGSCRTGNTGSRASGSQATGAQLTQGGRQGGRVLMLTPVLLCQQAVGTQESCQQCQWTLRMLGVGQGAHSWGRPVHFPLPAGSGQPELLFDFAVHLEMVKPLHSGWGLSVRRPVNPSFLLLSPGHTDHYPWGGRGCVKTWVRPCPTSAANP